MKRRILLYIIIVIGLFSCKKVVPINVKGSNTNYLVINGYINSGDSTTINLSRTVKVSDTVGYVPELNASVSIEGSQGTAYPLTSAGKGNYVSGVLNLPGSQNYRLKIVTSNGKQYASDFVPLKNAPPVDSVYYGLTSNGVQVYLNAHDAANSTHYYKWDYTETYIIHSLYESHWMVVNGDTIAPRTPDQQIYQCWLTDSSSNLSLGSSVNLSRDMITAQPIAVLNLASEKLHIRYSMLVRQHALTSDAYNYFNELKKNTEQIGSIFDAQPSVLTGNVHCISNPGEIVVGYVTAGATTFKRLFIDNHDIPARTTDITYYDSCNKLNLLYDYIAPGTSGLHENQVREFIYSGNFVPIDTITNFNTGFTASYPKCVDCTLRGTNKQPKFWK